MIGWVPLADVVAVVVLVVVVAVAVMLCARKMAITALERKKSNKGVENFKAMSDMEHRLWFVICDMTVSRETFVCLFNGPFIEY